METILSAVSWVAVLSSMIALFSFWKVNSENIKARLIAETIICRLDAIETLSDVQKFLDQKQYFRAMTGLE